MSVRPLLFVSLASLAMACAPTLTREQVKLMGSFDPEGAGSPTTTAGVPSPAGNSPFLGATAEDFSSGTGKSSSLDSKSTAARAHEAPRER